MKTNQRMLLRRRLDKYVFVVALLWVITTVAMVLMYRPGPTHASHPVTARPDSAALFVPQPAGRYRLL
ncbi:MAG TPA: hypothetical protein VFT65_00500 [Candidatus Angelobacter sp.]|nr:hypothetical protein [Candidatus Angelobacter sp.]